MRALSLFVALSLLGCLESRTVQSAMDASPPSEVSVSAEDAQSSDVGGLEEGRGDACVLNAAAECGDDGCGGLLPICSGAQVCEAGRCVAADQRCGDGWCAPDEGCHRCPADCACNPNQACDAAGGRCVCAPSCGGDACGPDSCAGTCGLCPSALFCLAGDCACAARCVGRVCGADGCDGSCGACSEGAVCDTRGLCVPAPVHCGDGLCGWGEDCATCAQDCGACCGDGVCIQGEDCRSCEVDCGGCCGDGICDGDETCEACAADCGCGVTGRCEAGACVCAPQCEGRTCGADGCGGECGRCADEGFCAEDGRCVEVPASCGDGACGDGEGCLNCPLDCGACCGDGECQAFERCDACAEDCGCESNSLCNAQTRACVCVPQCEGRACGADGCGGECGRCAPGMFCRGGACECVPSCGARVCGDDGCGGLCGACGVDEICDGIGHCVDQNFACGDGRCGFGEDCEGCPQDCQSCCGDGECIGGEDAAGCPQDCAPGEICGDGDCGAGEDIEGCPQDCAPAEICGDGDCGAGEDIEGCPQDCAPDEICGDGGCGATEDCSSCPQDCQACCGDGACAQDEDCQSCAQDCGCVAPSTCQGRACVCTPSCGAPGRICGADGCGGNCSWCGPAATCQPSGRCICDVSARALTPTSLGFNYAPAEHMGKWMGSEFHLIEDAFERDLLTLASLDVEVVRLVALPYTLGMGIEEGLGPNQWDMAELDAVRQRLPHIIQRFADHDIGVIIALAPNAYLWGGPSEQRRWWQFVYGDGGWADFTQDLVNWGDTFIGIVEGSTSCGHVLYYDLHNDVDYEVPNISSLVRAQLATAALLDGKIGLSLRDMDQIESFSADIQASDRQLAYVDFHVYPERGWNGSLGSHASTMRQRFPQSRLILGEVGSVFCENGLNEDLQATTLSWIFDEATLAGADAVLNWMLWDLDPGGSCDGHERIGLGFNSASPRNVYGWAVTVRSALPGGDFESEIGGWTAEGAGGTQELTLSDAQPTINQRYLKLRAWPEGRHWACTPRVPFEGSRVAISAYLRASQASSLWLKARFYQRDAFNQEQEESIDYSEGASFARGVGRFTPAPIAGPGSLDGVSICVGIQARGGASVESPAILDIDGFSVNAYSPR